MSLYFDEDPSIPVCWKIPSMYFSDFRLLSSFLEENKKK